MIPEPERKIRKKNGVKNKKGHPAVMKQNDPDKLGSPDLLFSGFSPAGADAKGEVKRAGF